MALQGNLEDFELTDLFQLIQLGQKDGGLRITTASDVGVVFFKDGMIIHAKTNHYQGEPAIDSILSWEKGLFIFDPANETTEHTVDMPIQQVMLDAARRIDELNKIQKLIPSFDAIVKIVEVPKPGVEKINLRPEEWKVLSFVDGAKTIRQIANKAQLSEFDTARILYGLITSGLASLAVPSKPKPPEPEPPPAEEVKEEEKKEGGGLFGLFKKK
jgi:hypothetical protein